ncbi:hypothetical protein [Flavobacterium sp. FlaQc-28]|uniref:hypothetical protein n=1 Tax=Flavobacterium sp. FlaQc-28 TaxID=3374178 RepID=UPI0037579F05
MYWQHIYELPNKNTEEAIKYFQKEVLSNFKQDNFQILDNTISFEISDDKVNFKKYGGTNMGTAFLAQLYMKYLVVIDFKKDKYRVTVKEIFLDNKLYGPGRMSGDISEFCTKKDVTLFMTGKNITTGLTYNDKHFLEKFNIDLTQTTNNKDW